MNSPEGRINLPGTTSTKRRPGARVGRTRNAKASRALGTYLGQPWALALRLVRSARKRSTTRSRTSARLTKGACGRASRRASAASNEIPFRETHASSSAMTTFCSRRVAIVCYRLAEKKFRRSSNAAARTPTTKRSFWKSGTLARDETSTRTGASVINVQTDSSPSIWVTLLRLIDAAATTRLTKRNTRVFLFVSLIDAAATTRLTKRNTRVGPRAVTRRWTVSRTWSRARRSVRP